jgi:hypothetical protein
MVALLLACLGLGVVAQVAYLIWKKRKSADALSRDSIKGVREEYRYETGKWKEISKPGNSECPWG